jgi:hypothetical protein
MSYDTDEIILSPLAAASERRVAARCGPPRPMLPGSHRAWVAKRPVSLLAIVLGTVFSTVFGTSAAAAGLPATIQSLDIDAMKLFDAAESGDWASAGKALDRAKVAGEEVKGLESAYVDAGGRLGNFYQVQNNLGADLIEASTALSVRDRRWLVSASDRIESNTGELSQPFADGKNAVVPTIETLLFLARRMRRALVWEDDDGLRNASADFRHLWPSLRSDLAGRSPAKVAALEQALTRIGSSPSRADVKALYAATRDLRVVTP